MVKSSERGAVMQTRRSEVDKERMFDVEMKLPVLLNLGTGGIATRWFFSHIHGMELCTL